MTTAWHGDWGHVNWHYQGHSGCTQFHSALLERAKIRDMLNNHLHRTVPNKNIEMGKCEDVNGDKVVWERSGHHDGEAWHVTVWMHN